MLQWYEMTDDQIRQDGAALSQRHLAYYNTFMATEQGRAVLYDLKRAAMVFTTMGSLPHDEIIALAALQDFIKLIQFKSGVTDQMAVICAESEIALRTHIDAGDRIEKTLYQEGE